MISCGSRGLALLLAAAAAASATGCGGSKPAQKQAGIVAAVLPDAKPEARAHFDEGLRLMAEGARSFEAARAAFVKAAKLDPKLYEAWHDIGIIEAKMGRWDAAVDAFESALDIQPASRASAVALGDVLRRAGRHDEAIAVYAKRSAAAPDDVSLRLLYVQALREGGHPSKAFDEVQALLAKDNKSADVFNALGLLYYKMEKYPLAESALRRAAELDPKSAVVWNNLGLVALARGHDQEAFEAFDKAADFDAKSIEARLNKAAVFLDCGDYKRALAELEKAAKVRPDDPDVLVALGVAHRGLGNHDRARRAYDRALVVQPDFPPALYNLGVLYMDFAKDPKLAREHLILYRKVAPDGDPKKADALARLKELK